MTAQLVAFVFMAALVLGGGLGAVTSRNVAHAALFLLLSLAGVAGVFILLVAEFLALVQVLIYGGAVTIVLLFALMLTRQEEFARVRDNPQRPLAAIAALALLGVLGVVFLGQEAESQPLDGPSIREVGSGAVHAVGDTVRGGVAGAAGGAHRGDHHRTRDGAAGMMRIRVAGAGA